MAPGSAGGRGDGDDDKDAKNMFDSIGKKVHDEIVKNDEAKKYIDELEGKLSFATLSGGELAAFPEPCGLIKEKHENLIGDRGHPCGNGSASDKRFSKERVAEYDEKKIRGNNEGECAPYRRLSLCNKNFQKINNYDSSNAKHNLLLDVCLAAHYEGDSIKAHYPPYQHKYVNSGSTICTVLARSFADIGDIIRGKDLYRRDNKKDKLQIKLKEYFKKIYEQLDRSIRSKYDETSENYFQLREDWWTANRHTVWKALTCKADDSNRYFRQTCDDSGTLSHANYKCRCKDKNGKNETNEVPTYFDYVPQYLRWFEEWAEDFCRKKKKKLENLQKQCRGKDKEGKDRYCSRNGYDCEKTISRIGKVRMGKGCTDCFFACYPYEKWIEKQKEQFNKQKNKYDEEIKKYKNGTLDSGRRRQKRGVGGTTTKVYDGYEKIFYEKLQSNGYGSVETFLEKLSKEKTCKDITDGGIINFKEVNSGKHSSGGTSGTNVESQGTFYRSKYCQPCPDCGVKHLGGGKFENKDTTGKKCAGQNLYKPKSEAKGTPINFLYSGDEPTEIGKKLKAFCDQTNGDTTNNGSNELYQKWTCYEIGELQKNGQEGEDDEDDVPSGGGLCILKKENKSSKEPADIQKTFNPFFYYWVAHMLKDSIYWETQKLERCLKNGTKTRCKNNNKCKTDCDCFQNWIKQKKEKEWDPIKQQFRKQDINGTGGNDNSASLIAFTHDGVLEYVLELEFANKNTEEDKENNVSAEEIDLINKMLKEDEKEENQGTASTSSQKKNTIDKLLKHEEGIAEKCKKIQEDCNRQQENTGVARSEDHQPPQSPAGPVESASDDEDDEEIDDDNLEEENVEAEEEPHTEEDMDGGSPQQDTQPAEVTEVKKDEAEKVCQIVGNALTETNLKEACSLKYAPGGKEKFPNWKCIPSGDTTSGESTTSSDSGSVCIPPRRRRLYVGKLHEWAEKQNTNKSQAEGSSVQAAQGSDTPDSASASSTSSLTDATQLLRQAFIQSAAVETFFLWHRYKKIKNKEIEEKRKQQNGELPGFSSSGDGEEEEQPPDKQLLEGKIPEEFKRQMFYTLGDYRDILFGNNTDILEAVTIGSNNKTGQEIMQAIQKKIKETLESGSTEGSGPKKNPSENPRKKWWEKNVESIWNGMICALTYKDNSETGPKGKTPEQDPQVKKAFFGDKGTSNEPIKYKYTDVKLEDENSGEKTTLNNPKLENFVEIPTFFRWLHEWGSDFCDKRARMLKNVRDNCMDDNGKKQKCSCYGEDCQTNLNKPYNILPSFYCPGCGKSCSSYRKWIEKKKTEYDKQKGIYNKEYENAQMNNGGNGSCITLKTCTDAASFLKRLGPCSKTYIDNGKDKKIFEDNGDTFEPATNCKPCSLIGAKCKNGHCKGAKEIDCKSKTHIDVNDFQTRGNFTDPVDMLVSDNDAKGFADELNDDCKDAHIFKGIRKDVWKCGTVCGVDICKLQKNNNGEANENQIIQIRALMRLWLEYFFDDYNKIKHKISHCTKKGEKTICINDCVEKWINKKKKEWQQIRDRYVKQYKGAESDMKSSVKNFLEDLQSQIAVTIDKAIKPCGDLKAFEKSCGLNSDEPSEKEGEERDLVLCLLDKLGKKAKKCEEKHQASGNQQQPCQKSPAPVGDDDDPLEEENPVTQPNICPAPQKEEAKEEGSCEPPATAEETEPAAGGEQTPKEAAPPPEASKPEPPSQPNHRPQRPRRPQPTSELLDNPHVQTALMSSTIMWSIGIGFAAFTYFFLK
ncbi:hypothetical protein PFTANZ_00845, partial [Plasmodium falciparum Tanzania (2000708)]